MRQIETSWNVKQIYIYELVLYYLLFQYIFSIIS